METGWKKYKYISKAEYRGIKMPASRGGNFVTGTHERTYATIRQALEEADVFPNNVFSVNDLFAFIEWEKNYEGKPQAWFLFETRQGESIMRYITNPLFAFDDLAVNVYGIAKIGTFDDYKKDLDGEIIRDIVYHADKEPHITFAPHIREGFRIIPPPRYPFGFKFVEDINLFTPDKPTSTQFLMNREAQIRLSEETGREV